MFCEHCGKKLEEGARFCEFCGQPTGDVPEERPEPAREVRTEPVREVRPEPAPQPSAPGADNMGRQPRTTEKKSVLNLKTLGIVGAAAVVLVGAGIFFTHRGDGKLTPPEKPPVETAQQSSQPEEKAPSQESQAAAEKPAAQEAKPAETAASGSEKTGQEGTAPAENVPVAENELSTEPSGGNYGTGEAMSDEEALKAAAFFSTDEAPNIMSFEWFLYEDMYNQVFRETAMGWDLMEPELEGKRPITNRQALNGGWQMLHVFDPARDMNSFCHYYATAVIETYDDNAQIITHNIIYMNPDTGEAWDMSTEPEQRHSGRWQADDSMMVVSDSEELDLLYYYEYNGRQYALGTSLSYDGIPGFFVLQRP